MPDSVDITPDTRVGTLLEAFPQLEETLVELAPAFKKLRNPVLRKTVAKVTSLRQAAKVGNVPLGTLVNTLRKAVGQSGMTLHEADDTTSHQEPEWLDRSRIVQTLDAGPLIESGGRPVATVMPALESLEPGQVFELITPFEPAPLMDMAKQKGYEVWSTPSGPESVKTYFCPRLK